MCSMPKQRIEKDSCPQCDSLLAKQACTSETRHAPTLIFHSTTTWLYIASYRFLQTSAAVSLASASKDAFASEQTSVCVESFRREKEGVFFVRAYSGAIQSAEMRYDFSVQLGQRWRRRLSCRRRTPLCISHGLRIPKPAPSRDPDCAALSY